MIHSVKSLTLTARIRQWLDCASFSPTVYCGMLLLLLSGINQALGNENQDINDIRQVAENYALRQVATSGLEASSISAVAGSLDNRLRLARCNKALSAFSMSANASFGRVTVGVRCEGQSPWTLYVPVTVSAQVPTMVTSHDLNRGDILSAADVEFVDKAFDRIPNNPLFNLDQLKNMELVRPLKAGTVLTASMLKEKMLVTRGQSVIIVANGSGIEVRMAGVAMENGKSGQLITVKNANSGRQIEGRVLANGTIGVNL